MIKPVLPILDHRTIKFHCLQAYLLIQLEEAEALTQQGKGKLCVNEKNVDVDIIGEACKTIANRIKCNGNTHEGLAQLAARLPYVSFYYNEIGKTVKKYFKEGQAYIPSLLCLTALQEYTLKGHKGFEDLDFNNLISGFEGIKENNVILHFKCGQDIIETLAKLKYKKAKRLTKKKK